MFQGGPQFGRNFSRIDLLRSLQRPGVSLARRAVCWAATRWADRSTSSMRRRSLIPLVAAMPSTGPRQRSVVQDFQLVANMGISDHWAFRIGVDIWRTRRARSNFHNLDNNTYFDANHGVLGRAQIRYANGPLDATLILQDHEYHVQTTNFSIYVPKGTVGYLGAGFTGDPFNYYQNAGGIGRAERPPGPIGRQATTTWAGRSWLTRPHTGKGTPTSSATPMGWTPTNRAWPWPKAIPGPQR